MAAKTILRRNETTITSAIEAAARVAGEEAVAAVGDLTGRRSDETMMRMTMATATETEIAIEIETAEGRASEGTATETGTMTGAAVTGSDRAARAALAAVAETIRERAIESDETRTERTTQTENTKAADTTEARAIPQERNFSEVTSARNCGNLG